MGKKKSENIVDLDRARRIKENVKKIKDIYKDDPDGLNRLAEKLRKVDERPKHSKARKACAAPDPVKCNASLDSDMQNRPGIASCPDASDDENWKKND